MKYSLFCFEVKVSYENKYSQSIAKFLNTKNIKALEKEVQNGLKITQNDYSPLFIKSLFKGTLEYIDTNSISIIFHLNAHNPSLNPFSKTPLLASYFIAYNLKRGFEGYSFRYGEKIYGFVENLAKQGACFKMQDKDIKNTIISLSLSLSDNDTNQNRKVNDFLQHYYLITENKDMFKSIFQKLSRLKEYHHMVNFLMPFIEKEKLESLFTHDDEQVNPIKEEIKKEKRHKI
jgi:hypothetical protein